MGRPRKKYRDRPGTDNEKYREWKRAVLARDSYCCQMCPKTTSLQAHHIRRWADCPTIRYDVDNGITLCFVCHKSIHGREDEMAPVFLRKIKKSATDPARLKILYLKYGVKNGPKEEDPGGDIPDESEV
jgi:5-methylcytosine-specific restriction endonuclease McrA